MSRRTIVSWLIAVVLAAGFSAPASAEEVDRASIERLLQRLEQSSVDPLQAASETPDNSEEPDPSQVRRALVMARAIRTVESSVDTSLSILRGEVLTPLSLARNYRHLGMRRRALRWYDGALTADKQREYRSTLYRERARCAIEIGDSTLVHDQLEDMLELRDAARFSETLASLLAALGDGAADSELESTVRRIERLPGSLAPSCHLEIARFWQRTGNDRRAHERYRRLIQTKAVMDLEVAARGLKGLAESAVASGHRKQARELFARYRQHDIGWLAAWSTYRLGQLSVIDGDFETAEAHFQSLCERAEDTPWRNRACVQLAQARQLRDIHHSLGAYGLGLNMKSGGAR